MAEENTQFDTVDFGNHDDMSAMRVLLYTVRGLSPVSSAPALELVAVDDVAYSE